MTNKRIKSSSFFCTREGLSIRGKIFEPINSKSNLPIVIISHPFMLNYHWTKKYARWFAENGYLAVCYDFNGGGLFCKSDKDTTKMSVFTEVEDLKAVIKYIKSFDRVDKNEITLMGCSQGGVVSALVAAELKEEISNLILFYPALCIPDDASKGKMMFSRFDPHRVPDKIRCGPMMLGREYVTSVQGFDLMSAIIQYRGRTLIVHGTKDKVVDSHYVVEANNRYSNSDLRWVEGGTHIFGKKADKIALAYLQDFIQNESNQCKCKE